MISKVMQLWSSRTRARSHMSWLFYPYSFSLTSPSQHWVPFYETVHAETGHLAWLPQHPNLILVAPMGTHTLKSSFWSSCVSCPGKLWDRREGPSPLVGTDGQSDKAGLAACSPSGWVGASWMLEGRITGDSRVGGGALPMAGGTESFVPPKNWIQI